MPPAPLTGQDEARQCSRLLLDAAVHEDGPCVRDLIEEALDEDENARLQLLGAGIRVDVAAELFLVANSSRRLEGIFAGTDWGRRRWPRVLRRLSGVRAGGPHRFEGQQRRGSLVPADYLDEEFAPRYMNAA